VTAVQQPRAAMAEAPEAKRQRTAAKQASTRTLGSGACALETSEQGFGLMGITAFYGKPMPDDDAVALLKHAFARGITHWDTAEAYQVKGKDDSTIYNEDVLRKAIVEVGRENLQIATKYMPSLHDNELTPELAIAACRASCKRLGVDFVDLYYVHRRATKTSVEDQARSMKAVVEAGLAKFIGVSEFGMQNIRAFHKICPITAVQQEWSLMNRDLEEELVPTCRELGIGIVAYSPLCRSLLSGQVKSASDLKEGDLRTSRYGRFAGTNLEQNASLVDEVSKLAADRGVSTAQLSLAWVAHQGSDVVPIPGTTKICHLNENVDSISLVLSSEDMELLAAAVPQDSIAGDRYCWANNTFKDN